LAYRINPCTMAVDIATSQCD
jgi:hypothetical protein